MDASSNAVTGLDTPQRLAWVYQEARKRLGLESPAALSAESPRESASPKAKRPDTVREYEQDGPLVLKRQPVQN